MSDTFVRYHAQPAAMRHNIHNVDVFVGQARVAGILFLLAHITHVVHKLYTDKSLKIQNKRDASIKSAHISDVYTVCA